MSRIRSISTTEFLALLEAAQQSHLAKNEPIPKPRAEGLEKLESCLQQPFQSAFGKNFYPGFRKKAAILFYLLIKNHPLENGNKRMACLALSYFCQINRYVFDIPQEDFYYLAKNVATSFEPETGLRSIEIAFLKYLIRLVE